MIASRLRISLGLFLFAGLIVIARLFYWQLISGDKLAALADKQHLSQIEIPASRGKIITSDGFTLVGNQPAFLIYSYLPYLKDDPQKVAKLLAPILAPEPENPALVEATEATLSSRLTNQDIVWTPLARKVLQAKKDQVAQLNIAGIDFEVEQSRFYPEASMSAHLLGFVGSDSAGNSKGYFGLEGFYDLELKGRPGIIRQEKDATGKPILVGDYGGFVQKHGRDLKLYLDRSIQKIIEIELEKALKRYGAKSGEILIMEPKSGGILASASLPAYDPERFTKFNRALFKNPTVADSYEPGSTFKVLVMAAALDSQVVKPDTKCDICDQPLTIGKYTIRTWNNKYSPGINMTEVIQHSDNVGMVFTGFKLGKERLYNYLTKFGIGKPTGVDLQEESAPQLRPLSKWADIDLATASFGQGIAVTALQMLTAVSAIANDGVLMQPKVVSEIIGDTIVKIHPKSIRRVISQDSAEKITVMMVNAVENGEAQWTYLPGYKIAGKTGTAQIAVAGRYDREKTVASFVGFAPADDPKFAMLVKLREPTSSPWAAETAAPLWMKIAKKLFLYYGLPPSK